MQPPTIYNVDRIGISDPTISFPRTSWEGVVLGFQPFRPHVDDVMQLRTAARYASKKWEESSGVGLTQEIYLLAVADKAMEILLYKYDEEFPKRMPTTREAWRRSLKRSIIPKAIEMAEQVVPSPVSRKELVDFVLLALDAHYEDMLHAQEPWDKNPPSHDYMKIVSKVKLPTPKPPIIRDRKYKVMSKADAKQVFEIHDANIKAMKEARSPQGAPSLSSGSSRVPTDTAKTSHVSISDPVDTADSTPKPSKKEASP